MTTFHHKIHLDDVDDREQYVRRWEHLSWQHYVRMARALADTPLDHRVNAARGRVAAAKAEFAQAWRALDGATR